MPKDEHRSGRHRAGIASPTCAHRHGSPRDFWRVRHRAHRGVFIEVSDTIPRILQRISKQGLLLHAVVL